MRKWRKWLVGILMILLTVTVVPVSAEEKAKSYLDPNRPDATIGVLTGTTGPQLVSRCLPDAKIKYFSANADCIAALTSGIVDALCMEEAEIRYINREIGGLYALDGYLDEVAYGCVFQKSPEGEKLRAQINEFIREAWDTGLIKGTAD